MPEHVSTHAERKSKPNRKKKTAQARWWGKSGEIPALTRNGKTRSRGAAVSPVTRDLARLLPPVVVRGPESGLRAGPARKLPDRKGPR